MNINIIVLNMSLLPLAARGLEPGCGDIRGLQHERLHISSNFLIPEDMSIIPVSHCKLLRLQLFCYVACLAGPPRGFPITRHPTMKLNHILDQHGQQRSQPGLPASLAKTLLVNWPGEAVENFRVAVSSPDDQAPVGLRLI